MVTTKLNLSMTEPQVRQIYAKQGDTGRVLDITLDQTPEDGTLRILRPDGTEVTSEAVTGGEVESGSSFESLTEADVTELTVGIEPIQDLNGYDKPWVGGAGKNKMPTTATSQTVSGVNITINDDGSFHASGTATADIYLNLGDASASANTWIASCGVIGSWNTYGIYIRNVTDSVTINMINVQDYTFTLSDTKTIRFILFIKSGQAMNTDFYPMLRLSTETDTWQPYSNICPITGHDEVEVTRTGKNLCSQTGVNNAVIGQAKQGKTYTFSIRNQGSCGYNIKKNNNSGATLASTEREHPTDAVISVTFTADEDCNLFLNGYGRNGYAFAQSAYDYQLELGSTATAYEPYQGSTYTTSLGQTVYGGTLDMVSGALTVDKAMVDLSSLSWTYDGSVPRFFSYGIQNTVKAPSLNSEIADIICTQYISASLDGDVSLYGGLNGSVAVSAGKVISVRDEAYTSASTFKDAMEGVMLCYALATPVEYQLTAQQIKTLVGTNNVWASSGDIVSITFTYGGLLSGLPSEATEVVGKCYCDVEQNGVSSMPFTLNVKKNERES